MIRTIRMLLVAGSTALAGGAVAAQGTEALYGTWEGPWYRGMSSGLAKLQVADSATTLQLTNSETFGEAPRPLVKLVVRGDQVSLRADGSGGAPFIVELKLDDRGDQMKGMGKYEGFGVRLELRRTDR